MNIFTYLKLLVIDKSVVDALTDRGGIDAGFIMYYFCIELNIIMMKKQMTFQQDSRTDQSPYLQEKTFYGDLRPSTQFVNKILGHIFQSEIEFLCIDEFTTAHLNNIANKYSSNSFEFKDYLLNEKKFNVFWHWAGFFIFQQPNLNLNILFDEIDSHYQTIKNQNGITLYEIVNQYKELGLNTNAYSFSQKSIVEKLNQTILTN